MKKELIKLVNEYRDALDYYSDRHHMHIDKEEQMTFSKFIFWLENGYIN